MALWHVFVVLAVIFVAGFFGAKYAVGFNDKHPRGYDNRLDLSIGCVYLICALIAACFFTHVLTSSLIFTVYAILAMGIVCLVFIQPQLRPLHYLTGCFGICFLSTYFLPSHLFPDSYTLAFFMHLKLAAVWVVLMWIFTKMDRVPFFSMIFTTSIVLCLFLLSGFFDVLPQAFGYLGLTLLIMQMGANMYLKKRFLPRLGVSGAGFVGYFMGFFVIYLMAMGYTTAAVILYAYPAMELVLALGASFGLYQVISLRPAFLVEQALAKNIVPTKVLQSLMVWGILMAALATLSVVSSHTGTYVYYIALVIILVNIYIRLNDWGIPRPRLRDVGHDLKEGLKEAKKEWMTLSVQPVKEADKKPVATSVQPSVKGQKQSALATKKGPVSKKTSVKKPLSAPKTVAKKTTPAPKIATVSKKSPVKARGKKAK